VKAEEGRKEILMVDPSSDVQEWGVATATVLPP